MRFLVDRLRSRPLLAILILAAVLRLGVVAAMDLHQGALSRGFLTAAACEFSGMAHGLLKHGTFTYFQVGGHDIPSAYQPPLYPLLFAGVFSTLGDGTAGFLFVQLLQIAFGVAMVWLAYRVAQEVTSEWGARLAALLTAIWPTLIYAPVEAHSVSLLMPLLLANALLTIRLLRGRSRPREIWALGIVMGISALIRSEVVFLLLPIVVLMAIGLRRRAAVPIAIVCGCVLLPIGLWVGRNAAELGRPVLTTTAGLNLWRGDGTMATGGSYLWNGQIAWDTPATAAAVKALPYSRDYELRLDGIYADALRDELAHDPMHPVRLLPTKLAFFLTSDLTHPKGKSPVVLLPNLLGLPFLFVGLVALWRKREYGWPILLWSAFYLLISVVTFPLPRFRMNVEPLLLVTTAAGVVSAVEWRAARQGRSVKVEPKELAESKL